MAQSILLNTSIATVGRVINIFLGVVVTALVTRILGPGLFGYYILLFSAGALIQLSADFGLYLTLTRSVAQRPDQTGVLLSQIFSLRLLLLAVIFSLSVIAMLLVPSWRSSALPFVVLAIGLSFQSFSQLLMGIYQHRQVVWRATLGDLLGRTAQIASIILFGLAVTNVNSMIAAFTISAVVAYFLHLWLLPVARWRLVVDWPAWKKIISVSWPLGAMLLVNAVYFRIDMLVLSIFRPAWEVGWYGAAYRVIESALFFPAMLGGLLLPRLSAALAEQAPKLFNQYLLEGFRVLLVLSLYCLLVLLFFGRSLLLLISGPSFLPASYLLQTLSVALAVMFFGNLFGFALVALGRQTFLLRLYLLLAAFNTVLNLLLIPRYGAPAAAWTTVATEALAAASAAYYVYRTTRYVWPAKLIFTAALVGVGGAALLYVLPATIPWAVRLLLFTVLYGALIFSAKIISASRLRLLRSGTVRV